MIELYESHSIALNSPLDRLFAQYTQERAEVERIAEFVSSAKAMCYFFDGAQVEQRSFHASVSEVFKLEPAIKAIDATYWQKAMELTDVMEYMPAGKRNEWHEMVCKHKTPPFEMGSVKLTLVDMLNSRAKFMAERVDGLFRALSGEHVTNQPQAFGKRFIMGYMLSYCSISYERANYIHDLRCVIGKFLGREIPKSCNTLADLNSMERDGQWNEFDGGAFKIRLYKKGTAHMEVHPDLAWQLNKVLAFLYPMAIPAEFRTKPIRKPKEHKLHENLISFEVMEELARGIPYHDKTAKLLEYTYKEPPSQPTVDVIEYLGGVKTGKLVWEFDYLIAPVLKELNRTGRVPEQKSHQFYPTPHNLAEKAVAWAGIKPEHVCLEPSAGHGALADLMPIEKTLCVEISKLHCEILKAKGHHVEQGDFLQHKGTYDRIVANPPFSDGRALFHVKHAASLLNKGGVLVAIMPASNKGKWIVEGKTHEWSEIYVNEFADASINVVMVKIYG